MSTDSRSGATILEANACWKLLSSMQVGRLAVGVADQLDIFPINFLVDKATIVFRTAEGTKLAAVVISPHVVFEVDSYDPAAGQACSVVLKGQAEEITQAEYDLLNTGTLPLFAWQAGPKDRFVRIVPTEISGRRFHVLDPSAVHTPAAD